jgi:hypothetical protein
MYERLDSLQVSLDKHIVRNKKHEKVLIHADSIDFQKELEFFTDAVISKNSYSDYKIKSLKGGCEKYFQTISNSHSIKNFYYNSCNDFLVVYIDMDKVSPLFGFKYHLELNKNGFLIEIKSNVKLSYDAKYRIEGKFVSKKN